MTYAIKEIYKTLQGEGGQMGRAAVFCRFVGCNLWSGSEADRATAVCSFCDTDFAGTDGPGGGKFSDASALAGAIVASWGDDKDYRLVVFTGGEPLLQLDISLITAMKSEGFTIAVESNGTIAAPHGIDWLCISPKAGSSLLQRTGTELKLVYPQNGVEPSDFEGLAFTHFFLQPMDGPNRVANTALAIDYCLQHPRWRMSLQAHKIIGIP